MPIYTDFPSKKPFLQERCFNFMNNPEKNLEKNGLNSLENIKQMMLAEKYLDVISLLKPHLQANEYDLEALHIRAQANFKLEQFAESLADFDYLLNLLPKNADIYADRGLVRHFLRDSQGALADFDMAQEIEPENPFRYACRAFIWAAVGNFENAVNDYEKAIELDPDDAVAHNNLGLLQEKLGRNDIAQNHFKVADKLSGVVYSSQNNDLATEKVENITQNNTTQDKIENNQQNNQQNHQQKTSEKNIKNSYWSVFKQVFTEKDKFKEFLYFIMGKKM